MKVDNAEIFAAKDMQQRSKIVLDAAHESGCVVIETAKYKDRPKGRYYMISEEEFLKIAEAKRELDVLTKYLSNIPR